MQSDTRGRNGRINLILVAAFILFCSGAGVVLSGKSTLAGPGWGFMSLGALLAAASGGSAGIIMTSLISAGAIMIAVSRHSTLMASTTFIGYSLIFIFSLGTGLLISIRTRKQLTAAHQLDRASRESETQVEYNRHILDTIFSGFLIYSTKNFIISDCNNPAAQLLRLARSELIGRDVRGLFPSEEQERIFDSDGSSPTRNLVEVRLPTGTGGSLVVLLSRGRIGTAEDETEIMNILDVTRHSLMEKALQESRARYHELFEEIPVGLFRITGHGAILEANMATVRILRYPDAPALLTTNVADLFYDSTERNTVMRELQGEDSRITREIRMKTPQGDPVWIRVSLHRGGNAGSNLSYFDGVLEDISDTRAREEERRAATLYRDQAKRMEAIGTLAGGVAHEFNNILAGMALRLHIMTLKNPGDDHLEEFSTLVRRAERVVDGLLSALGKVSDSTETFNLEDAVDQAMGETMYHESRGTALRRLRYGEELPIHGSREDIVLAIRELLRNSMAASGENARVNITTDIRLPDERLYGELARLDSSYAVIEVSDEGQGIKHEILDRIFEPFFTTHEFGEGRGLGLTRVYGIVKRHNGGLYVDSHEGNGTTVALYLPLVSGETANTSG